MALEQGINEELLRIAGDASLTAKERWRIVSREHLNTDIPFAVHQQLYAQIYKGSDERPYAWFPGEQDLSDSHAARIMRDLQVSSYDAFLQAGLHSEIMLKIIKDYLGIQFQEQPNAFCDASDPTAPQWLPGAQFNVVESCFTANPDAIAIREQLLDNSIQDLTFADLRTRVDQHVAAIQTAGCEPGERIALAMPMTADAVVVFLGIVASGCTAVLLAESFSSEEIAVRCEICQPKLIFTQDVVIRGTTQLPLYEKVRAAYEAPCIVRAATDELAVTLRDNDQHYADFLSNGAEATWISTDPQHHILILFSSGTTGTPKAIPWYQVMPIKSALDALIHHDIQTGDRVCWPTSLGWMMGPWLVFASLINKGCVALTHAAPTTRAFGTFVQDAGVDLLGLVPSMVRAWRKSDCMRGLNWDGIRAFSSTGECSNAEDMLFLMSLANYKPIIEYCGGTEVAGGYITGTRLKPHVPGQFNSTAFGFSWFLLNEEGQEDRMGEVYLHAPVMGLSNELLNADHHQVYYADTPSVSGHAVLRRHGDQIEDLGDGYFRAHGRIDDTMNLGGIKVSAVEIETLLQQDKTVLECAAIEVPPPGGGPGRLVIYAVAESVGDEHELQRSLQLQIKEKLNPLFRIHLLVLIEKLPRTASNKIMRRSLRSNFQNRQDEES